MNQPQFSLLTSLREAAATKRITLREHPEFPHYLIANYTPATAYDRDWDGLTLMCRGLMVNAENGSIIGRGFNKFFNLGEPLAPAPDFPAEVYPKFDGSLGISYRAPDGTVRFATRGSFDSPQAQFATRWFEDHAVPVPDGTSLLVEIIYPENRICVDYGDRAELVLLGAVDHASGTVISPEEMALCMGWHGSVARPVPVGDLDEETGHEGYVVREAYVQGPPRQYKLKTAWYLAMHRAVAGLNLRQVFEWSRDGVVDQRIADLPNELQAEAETLAEAVHEAHRLLNLTAITEFVVAQNQPRKDVAMRLKGSETFHIVMARLSGDGVKANKALWSAVEKRLELT